MDPSLLPAPETAPPCAAHTRAIGIDPAGTAIRADVLIAVEVALPWPKPVFAHPALARLPESVAAGDVPARVLAAVPVAQDRRDVIAYRRTSEGVQRSMWRCTTEERAVEIVEAILRGDAAEPDTVDDEHAVAAEVWICTQGSHDRCCGSEGTRLAVSLAGRDDLVVRRVSHTGGHRFAPTGVTFPGGRMWAHLDEATVEAIVGRSVPPAGVAGNCRGWWGADAGPAQAAERALFSEFGWTWEDRHRRVEVSGPGPSERSWMVRVESDLPDGGPIAVWNVEVAVAREVPTITCAVPGGVPVKPAEEYRVLAVTPSRKPG